MTDTTKQTTDEQSEIDKAAKHLQELLARKTEIEEKKKKLEQEKKQLKLDEAKIKREEASAKRSFETKGKVLIGAAIIQECKRNYSAFEAVKAMLNSFLTRDIDREAVQHWLDEIEAEHVQYGTKPQPQPEPQPVQDVQDEQQYVS